MISKAPATPTRCFNGATAFRRWKHYLLIAQSVGAIHRLQWGHRLSAMETRSDSIVCPWRDWLQWGHRLSAMETSVIGLPYHRHGQGFNGATAFRRWKHKLAEAHALVAKAASMGPPPFGDGNMLARRRHRWSCGFNGATAFRRWKLFDSVWGCLREQSFNGATAFRRWKLQDLRRALPHHLHASMGPPPFGDGNYCVEDVRQLLKVASMGPPPFGDGNFRYRPERDSLY